MVGRSFGKLSGQAGDHEQDLEQDFFNPSPLPLIRAKA
jgi:hypothetical protein